MRENRHTSRYAIFATSALLALTSLGCGDDAATPGQDAGTDSGMVIDGSPVCMEDSECQDTSYCNGEEFCDDGVCKRGARPSCDDGIACTTDRCSESLLRCVHEAPDFDGDGHFDATCVGDDGPLGDDCDDDNADRYPGNIEVCDAAHVDEDCNPATLGNRDRDGDGAIDQACCNQNAAGTLVCGSDCDDNKPSVRPGASEICDLFDNDCDGMTDEEGAVMLFPDRDFDGHGEEDAAPEAQCAGTPGYAAVDDDCDDADPAVHAAQVEICDGKDNDCDGKTDEQARPVFWYRDLDGDGFGGRLEPTVFSCVPPVGYDLRDTDCDDEDPAIHPAAAELCDGIDNNCDGKKTARIGNRVNDFEDDDDDGSPDFACGPLGNDCDDNDKSTGGNLLEICDKLDNDCDGLVDEDVADTVWYVDADGDGYGNERLPAVVYCAPLAGRSAYPGDCNDADASIHPGAFEVCGMGLVSTGDEDCDGLVDEGFCPVCGDGVAEGPEQCDDRATNSSGVCVDPDGVCNSDTLPDACRENCVQARCGDGVIDTGEVCDGGNANSDEPNALCRTNCQPQRCGDGIVDTGEACDDATAFCRSDCTAALWTDGICAPVTADLGSAVGANVVAGDTTGGSTAITIDGSDVVGMCSFTNGAPSGPERVYTWQSPATMLYGFAPSNSGLASRLTVALFFNDDRYATNCTEPWACLEPAASTAMIARVPNAEGAAVAIDSAAGQAFNLSIFPMLCCPDDTDPVAASACFTAASQADFDCAINAVATSCLSNWTAACATTADAACAYTCP